MQYGKKCMGNGKPTELGNYLRQRRQEQGLSARALGNLAGIPGTTISRIENGEHSNPTTDTLRAVADALELPPTDLFSLAGYATELPTLTPYLHAKYHDQLDDDQIAELGHYFDYLTSRYGPQHPTDGRRH
jgi:transcriptional regulator with XRE-family HTH domain